MRIILKKAIRAIEALTFIITVICRIVRIPAEKVIVIGDACGCAWVIALRAVETVDFMTAQKAHLRYELLERVSGRIINEIAGLSCVADDSSGEPPANIE